MIKTYKIFEDVEDEIRDQMPSVVYKFRTWEDEYHKRIITQREAWFAHPHSLNDPYDLRPPYKFVEGEINWEQAKHKMREAALSSGANLTDEQIEIEVDSRIQALRTDPASYFQKNRGDYVLNKSHYDRFGIFSCCASCKNEAMWAHYGNNHCGFALGFKTVELARAMSCTFGFVKYDDTPINYNIMGDNKGLIGKEIFQKSTHWIQEQELRFVTVGIGITRGRASSFPANAVAEIIFGMNSSQKVQDEIREAALETLPEVIFYRIGTRQGSYGLEKVII